ncbi:MAG: energy-coupling factor ABC transporter permease [Gammaproteobacteria bacterium]|nr:energy-coupling factor ABC transporter permease [Gammaproteobacteria bacterium]
MTIETNWLIGLHIPAALIPASVLWFSNVLFAGVLVFAAMKVEFRQLLDNRPNQHVYFGAMVLLLMLWGVKAGVSPGLGFHHLGATLFTLMFGWPLALFGLSILMLATVLMQHNELISFGINGCLSIVMPVFTSYAILRGSQRFLPDNFYIYIFVVAFFGAGIAVAVSRFSSIVLLGLANAYPQAKLIDESLLYTPLFMFPEMFVTGMLTSIFVVYKPDWVITFDDERYITGK